METINDSFLEERMSNLRKLILIENIDNLGLSHKKKKKFIEYYYNNLNLKMNLMVALEEFKKLK